MVGIDIDTGIEGDHAITADVTDSDQVRDTYGEVSEKFGRIDVLFNNAGINPSDDGDVLETDAGGVAARPGRQPARRLPLLQARDPPPARGRGRVGDQHRLVRRGDGRRRLADLLHGVEGRGRLDVARDGRRVRPPRRPCQRALPGPVDTPLLQDLFASDRAQAERRLVHLPMGRFAEAREIAMGAVFLASDESSYVNATGLPRRRRPLRRLRHAGLSEFLRSCTTSRKRPQSSRPSWFQPAIRSSVCARKASRFDPGGLGRRDGRRS